MSATDWPDSLIGSMARQDFFLFIGSGVSASCKNSKGLHPPTWTSLIQSASSKLRVEAARKRVNKLSKSDLLDAAQMLLFEASRDGVVGDVLAHIAKSVESAPGDPFLPSEWHNEIVRLDPLILLTTNYDRILERATNSGYSVVHTNSTNFGKEIRCGNPVLVKLHGSVDDSESMVLSHSHYARLRSDSPHVLDVLRALFLTKPCLFLGYSLGDPDVRLLLEHVASFCRDTPAHYLLCEKPASAHTKDLFLKTYGVQTIEYPRGKHDDGLEMLRGLADRVDDLRGSAIAV